MMIVKIIFVIVTWLPAFLIACPTIIDGWTFPFKPDIDILIQGKFLNSQFPPFQILVKGKMKAKLQNRQISLFKDPTKI